MFFAVSETALNVEFLPPSKGVGKEEIKRKLLSVHKAIITHLKKNVNKKHPPHAGVPCNRIRVAHRAFARENPFRYCRHLCHRCRLASRLRHRMNREKNHPRSRRALLLQANLP